MYRLVLDTNVWVSNFLIPRGRPTDIIRSIDNGEHGSVTSEFILNELSVVLTRERLVKRYKLQNKDVADYISFIYGVSEIIQPITPAIVIRDPRDLPIIGTAISGNATHPITGDFDLLEDENLKRHLAGMNIQIVSPSDFAR